MLTLPPEVVAMVPAFVPFAFKVMLPLPLFSVNVPVVKTEPFVCDIVPVPFAVNVTDGEEPIVAANAMLPLLPVFCINTAPVALSKPFTVITGLAALLSVKV